jgi:DNA-binding CsgD family transcriptional regulator
MRPSLPLIERDAPLNSVLQSVARCRAGQGGIVIIGGEAGIGKTTLLREVARQTAGIKFHWGGSDALFTPRPFGPLCDMAAEIDPAIARLLDETAPQDRIFPALLGALQSARAPCALVFEDVHWADNATFDLIKFLGRRISFLPAVLILTYRSDEVGADHPLAQVLGDLPASACTRVALKPLTMEGIAELVRATGQDAAELHRITGGNPFFASELLANPDRRDDAVPASVRDAVWARLQRLGQRERELLEAVSIAPSGAEDWFAEALLGRNADDAIDACVSRGLLAKDGEERYRFRHELARAATLERLSPAAQKQLHRRAYDVLAKRPSFPVPCLIHHASGAGDAARVLELAPRAAREAITLGAHREAAAHLAAAMAHSASAPPELAAQIHEDWAYVEGVSMRTGPAIIAAAEKAVALWRGLGRKDKVAHNLRWLSRLHWFRGEGALAIRFADEAIETLAGEADGPELAMAYSARAQLYMFNDRFDEAIALCRKAITLAQEFGEVETHVHALSNLAGSMLFAGRDEGRAHMEECIALALAHGLHEQADRAYANYAEYAVLAKEFGLAERILSEGIAFNARHDLNAGIYMLAGRQAQMRMEQGRYAEAEAIAASVISLDKLALVGKLPALIVLAKTRLRTGKADGPGLVRDVMRDALATDEQQHIVPARLTLIEAAWLRGDLDAARSGLHAMLGLHLDGLDSWDAGALAVWWRRCAMPEAFPRPDARFALPRAAEFNGDGLAAAQEWIRLGLPYEAGLALVHVEGGQVAEALTKAVALLDGIDAQPAAAIARARAKRLGIGAAMPKERRGPYSAARGHPLGLTAREVQVMGLIAKGMPNQDIADHMARSLRTVEHHVSSVLGKLNAGSRMDIVLRLQNEPWLLPAAAN